MTQSASGPYPVPIPIPAVLPEAVPYGQLAV